MNSKGFAEGGPVNDNNLHGGPTNLIRPRFSGYSGADRTPVIPSSIGVNITGPSPRVGRYADTLPDHPQKVFDISKEKGHEGIFPSKAEAQKWIEKQPNKNNLDYGSPREIEKLNPSSGPKQDLHNDKYFAQSILDAFLKSKTANDFAEGGLIEDKAYSENEHIRKAWPNSVVDLWAQENQSATNREQGMLEMMQQRANPDALPYGQKAHEYAEGGQYWTPEGLAKLQKTEGKYEQIHYPTGVTKKGVKSSATGGFGFLDSTWREFAPKAGVDINQYPRAYMADPTIQNKVAAVTPTSHWLCSGCNDAAVQLAKDPANVSGTPQKGGDIKLASNNTAPSLLDKFKQSSYSMEDNSEDSPEQPNQKAEQLAQEHSRHAASIGADPLVQSVIQTIWRHSSV
jgi:hypothetical protein